MLRDKRVTKIITNAVDIEKSSVTALPVEFIERRQCIAFLHPYWRKIPLNWLEKRNHQYNNVLSN